MSERNEIKPRPDPHHFWLVEQQWQWHQLHNTLRQSGIARPQGSRLTGAVQHANSPYTSGRLAASLAPRYKIRPPDRIKRKKSSSGRAQRRPHPRPPPGKWRDQPLEMFFKRRPLVRWRWQLVVYKSRFRARMSLIPP